MAPYITPWSVMAKAGISSFAAVSTSAWMRLAPSSSEYSVWLCRWMKVLGACGIVWLWVGGTPAVVYLPPGNNPAQGVKDLSGAGVVAAGILPRHHQPTRRPAQSAD